ncbi:MAG: xanthine dehydrogenase family protein subunit M [Nitrososphaerales archaeon]
MLGYEEPLFDMGSLPPFEYLEPSTLQYALYILNRYGESASILAGGTDLLVQMRDGKKTPKYVVNIKKIPQLEGIRLENEGVVIGALTTVNKIHESNLIKEKFPALHQAAGVLASYQVRNRATIGGNLCNASPAADLAPPLLIYEAKLKIAGLKGEDEVPIKRFFLGPGKTVIEQGMILKEIYIPTPKEHTYSIHLKFGERRAMECAIINVAASISIGDSICEDAKIALGSVAPTPIRSENAEAELRGKKLDEEVIKRAAEAAAKDSKPISDIRASAEYRREMVKVFVRRALHSLMIESNMGNR